MRTDISIRHEPELEDRLRNALSTLPKVENVQLIKARLLMKGEQKKYEVSVYIDGWNYISYDENETKAIEKIVNLWHSDCFDEKDEVGVMRQKVFE